MRRAMLFSLFTALMLSTADAQNEPALPTFNAREHCERQNRMIGSESAVMLRSCMDAEARALNILRRETRCCLVFCDDLSFEREDADYKALKSVLDGGIEGRPANVLFYATSNRRHLMPRDMIENESRGAIHGQESVEEKVSLSDRFGLWIGFHNCDQDTFFAMIEGYAASFALPIGEEELRRAAVEWSVTRGGRSGRVAWQFVQEIAGRLGVRIPA